MKIILILAFISSVINAHSQSFIRGVVTDEKNKSLEYANVSIEGTVEGTTSHEDGTFELRVSNNTEIVLVFRTMGYETEKMVVDVAKNEFIQVQMKTNVKELGEIVVVSSGFNLKGGSTIGEKNAIELVTVAGSEGDLFKSLNFLPGVQVADTNGKLLVRGGDDSESQTYIDGMHVLNAYTTVPANVSARSRYSPFVFEGMNFEQGGYVSEYSQSLSSILPLTTKDVSIENKLGVQLLTTGVGSGGTKSWDKSSIGFNVDYNNMGPYYDLVAHNDRNNKWTKPYSNLLGQGQYRIYLTENTILKAYTTYSKTRFNMFQTIPFTEESRLLNMDEDNIYLNTTLRHKTKGGVNIFLGGAFSYNNQQIENGNVLGDKIGMKESELHLKTKASKRLTNHYNLEIGTETFFKEYDFSYQETSFLKKDISHNITGAYLSNDFIVASNLFFNASLRAEYTSISGEWNILPRLALNYKMKDLTIMGAYGKYQQLADRDYLLFNNDLEAKECQQFIAGAYYRQWGKLMRLELYHKRYDNLVCGSDYNYQAIGKGFSNGIDIFIRDPKFLKRWEYTLSYSYNNSKRQYDTFEQMVSPNYSTKHNAALSLKYDLFHYKTILGISNRFASGRPYHDPNKTGEMNAYTKLYNSVDLCATFLLHPKFIIYTSVSNVFNRDNIYGYTYSSQKNEKGSYNRIAKTPYNNQLFIVGFFLTLGGTKAYDPANF